MQPAQTVAQVLLDSSLPQLDHLFDYEVPVHLSAQIAVGQRVKVPLRAGARQAFGYVISLSSSSAHQGTLSPITELVSPVRMLTPQVARLTRTLADRAAGNANDILRLAIPTRQVRVEKSYFAAKEHEEQQQFEAKSQPDDSKLQTEQPRRSALICTPHPVRLSTGEWTTGWAHQLAHRAETIYRSERSVIIAVPDHHDLDMVQDAIRALGIEEDLLRVDAQQSNAQRYDSFLRALEPKPRIILGNRSAVYAPAHRLGMIVLWDDGDPLFDEPLTPYVHARDAALQRSELEVCDLLFAANVRSAEVQRLVEIRYLEAEEQPARTSRVILTGNVLDAAAPQRLPTLALETLRNALKNGPVLVQVASPGLATAIFCADCGARQRCTHCGGPLELQGEQTARCRWCRRGHTGHTCASCGGTTFRQSGAGATRTSAQFEQQFPKVPIKLSDGENRRVLVDSRPAIVVATRGAEPLAAGGYAAVLLLDGERMLSAESLRAEEETLRVWANATALAREGAIVVLTEVSGQLAESFALGTTETWLSRMLAERKQLRYPPAVRVATVTGPPAAVDEAVASVHDLPRVEVLEATPAEAGTVRRVVRFAYRDGAEVAKRLRAALIANATVARKPVARGTARTSAKLRLHFDDRAAFDERPNRKRRSAER